MKEYIKDVKIYLLVRKPFDFYQKPFRVRVDFQMSDTLNIHR